MKKLVLIIMAAVLALSLMLTGCGQTGGAATTTAAATEQATTAAAATTAKAEEQTTAAAESGSDGVEVTMLVTGHPSIIDWKTNKMTVWMEEQTGVKVNYKTIPTEGQLDALSLELNSNAYPDAFMTVGMNIDLLTRYGVSEHRLLPLNDLIKAHAPNLQNIFKINPGYEGMMTMLDGNIYCMPEINQCQHCTMHEKMWINIDFLEAVGKPMPNTTDEFVEVLKAFRDDDPNGNGEQDEIPFIGALRNGWGNTPEYFVMNAFVFYDATLITSNTGYSVLGLYLDGDTVKTPWAEPECIEGLKFMNMLVEEGLLYEGSFSAETDTMVNLVEGGDLPRVGVCVGGHGMIWSEAGGERYAQFRGMMPLEGPHGRKEIRKNTYDIGFNGFYISAETPHAEALVKWADKLYDFEATANGYYGPKGTNWRDANAGELGLDGKPALYMPLIPWQEVEPQNDHLVQQCISFRSSAFRAGEVYDQATPMDSMDAFEKRLYDTTAEMEKYANTASVMPPVKFTVEENSAISVPMTDLNSLVKQYIPGFISGTYDIDSEYDGFLEMLDNSGLADLVATYQKAYDEQFKK